MSACVQPSGPAPLAATQGLAVIPPETFEVVECLRLATGPLRSSLQHASLHHANVHARWVHGLLSYLVHQIASHYNGVCLHFSLARTMQACIMQACKPHDESTAPRPTAPMDHPPQWSLSQWLASPSPACRGPSECPDLCLWCCW